MKAAAMLCQLAPKAPGLDKTLAEPPGSLEDAVRVVAATGDYAAFDPLPPILMHNSEKVSAQKLWGGLHESRIASANYRPGAPKPPEATDRLLGGAIVSLQEAPHPVLLYMQQKTIVARVYDVPMSALESGLYARREAATPLETKWKGPELAPAHAEFIESIGAHMQSGGLACMPGYLFTKDPAAYHLVRPGPVPFLHMRAPATDHEFELVETMIHAALIDAAEPNEGYTAVPVREDDNLFRGVGEQVRALDTATTYGLETIFSKAPHPGASRVSTDSDKDRVAFVSKISRNQALISAMVALLNVTKMTDTFVEHVDAVAVSIAKAEMGVSSVVARTVAPKTLSSLTSCASRLSTVRRIGQAGISQAYVIASAIFAASDVGLAVRELSSDEGSRRAKEQGVEICGSVVGIMWNMAKRVDEITAVLCIELGPARDIRSLRLINSCVDYELDLDSAGRLLECPWVTVVAHLTTTQEPGGFFTIETAGVQRDMLKVCDSVRKTYGLEAQRHVRPLPPPPTHQVDFGEFDKRLNDMEKTVKAMQEVAKAHTPAPPISAAAPPAPPPVAAIPYTSPELERLKSAQKKWAAVLGKRAR